MKRKYIAFISYRHMPLDMAVAKKLHGLIEQYVIPKELRKDGQKKLGIVFRDQDELAASCDLSQDIQEALEQSEYLIVICTPDTPGSIWVGREIQYFLRTHSRQNILTVLAGGEPSESFPEILTTEFDSITNEKRTLEPLAVDIRAGNVLRSLSRLRRECKRLFAAILGCPYDALILREQKRHLHRIFLSTAVILMVTLGFVSMLWTKNQYIEQKNMELAQQKAQVQLRESQLLTADAGDALSAGDYLAAIRDAISALPNSDDPERPYYAPAESVLFQAMNVFGNEDQCGLLFDTVLEQMTSISDFCISGDGENVVTIDPYGTLNCFDAVSGEILWTTYVRGSDTVLHDSMEHVLNCGEHDKIISYYHDYLECHSLTSGQLLWAQDAGNAVDNAVFYNGEQDILLYIDSSGEYYFVPEAFTFVLLSGSTGEILHTIPFVQSENIYRCVFPNTRSEMLSNGGIFSSDGKHFAGIYAEETTNLEGWTLKFFLIDIPAGTAEICYQQEMDGNFNPNHVVGMQFADHDNALIIVLKGDKSSVATTAMKLDLVEGTQVWQTAIPAEDSNWFPSSNDTFVQFLSTILYVGRADRMYCLDAETGELLDTAELPSNIAGLNAVSSNTVAFFMEDGSYAIGWQNASGLHLTTDDGLQIVTSIGAFKWAQIYGGGILQFYSNDQEHEISVSNKVSEGYVAIVPPDEEQAVVIKRPSETMDGVEQTDVPLPLEDANSHDATAVLWDDDTLILGPYCNEACDYYAVFDLISHEITNVINVENLYCNAYTYFLPDGTGYVQYTIDGNILREISGEKMQMSVAKDYITREDGSRFYIGLAKVSDAAYLTETQEVLTAKLETDTLLVWKNGEETVYISLPENQIIGLDDLDAYSPYLKVCSNGDILISNHFVKSLSNFSVYDISTDSWVEMTGETVIPNTDAITVSGFGTRWAVVDDHDTVWIYDYIADETVSSFPLQLPYGSVTYMCFLLEDSCLMVKTQDNQVLIYNTVTGEILFRDQLLVSDGGWMNVIEDKANQRLYISDSTPSGTPNGFCLDLRTWTKLSNIRNMIFFDATRGELYQRGNDTAITRRKIPSTAELISAGKKQLS